MSVPRVEPHEVKSENALLVCAYDSDEKFRENHLEGALPLSAFKRMEPSLAKDREIIFYCQ